MADDCITCHLGAAYNLLVRAVEIFRLTAIRKRHNCTAAGQCSDTSLPMTGNEPPGTADCECFLVQDLAYAVLDTADELKVLLEKADRLAQTMDPGGERYVQ